MEEKVLIKSEQCNVKKVFVIMFLVGAILSLLVFGYFLVDQMSFFDFLYDDDTYEEYAEHQAAGSCGKNWYTGYVYGPGEKCNHCITLDKNNPRLSWAIESVFEYYILYCFIPIAVFALIGSLVYLWLRSYELTVTDKRIYGKVAWGKRVDLPVDSVSATATISVFNGVAVSTSSGRISFLVIKNADEIYKVVNDLLIERQQKKANVPVAFTVEKNDEAEQIKKYKELLDSGIITQEEFDAKKKQLLGL